MKVVVLAAGEGRRLGPLTEGRPKPMLPLRNRPILEEVIESAVAVGVDEVIVVVGYERDRIQTYFGDGDDWDVDIEYVVQERQVGAAHALSQVESAVEGHFLALHGDQLVDERVLERLLARWEETATPTIVAVQSDRPADFGAVEVDGERVRSVSRTPTEDPPLLVNAGAYVFDERVFDAIREVEAANGAFEMATVLQRLADAEALSVVLNTGRWQDLTYPWDLLASNATLLGEDASEIDRRGIHGSAALSDDVAVGSGVSVGPNATVLSGTSLGDGVRIGANATLANCIVMDGADIGDGAVLRDCIVGEAATVGANSTVEGGPADVVVDDTVHRDVGLGGVVADRATVRGNVTVVPGTVLGREVLVDSGAVVRGKIASGETVRRA